MSVQHRHQKPLHTLIHKIEELEVRREKGVSEAGVRLGSTAVPKLLFDCWHPPECQFYKTESGCKFGNKCSFPHWKVEEQPNKKPKKDGDKNAVATVKDVRQLGCVLQDTEPRQSSSISRTGTEVLGPIRRVRSTRAAPRYADIRENKGPSMKKKKVKLLHQRSPHAVKFEDRSQEEIERQERCARGDAWRPAKNNNKFKETDKTTFFSPTEEWRVPALSTIKPEEREFFCRFRREHAHGEQGRPVLCRIGTRQGL